MVEESYPSRPTASRQDTVDIALLTLRVRQPRIPPRRFNVRGLSLDGPDALGVSALCRSDLVAENRGPECWASWAPSTGLQRMASYFLESYAPAMPI